jgi:hypothetical protein
MGKVICNATASLDGYVAGPDETGSVRRHQAVGVLDAAHHGS